MVIRSKQKLNISKPFNIVLVNPEIPPNTGNIARLCAATSTKLHLVHPLGFTISDKELKRAGLDYWHLLDIEEHNSWEEFKSKYTANSWYLSTRGERNIWDVEFNPGDFFIFGSETKGLNEDILNLPENKEFVISIPMNGLTRSINLSTAVGIVLYEGLRQLTIEKEIFGVVPI
ncbi:MAG: tRNA (cytidine(34)-2'-O)-methyltransferase [Candidatus Melainabacteria bacterium]|nr:tRNA (cytidine(34)-2'-O)-methyltransferase [Candidatus Melainabacteria bacterium]